MAKHRKSAKKAAAGRIAAASRLRDENGKFIKASASASVSADTGIPAEIEAVPQVISVAANTPPEREFTNRYLDSSEDKTLSYSQCGCPREARTRSHCDDSRRSSSQCGANNLRGSNSVKAESGSAYRPRTARAMARKIRTGEF